MRTTLISIIFAASFIGVIDNVQASTNACAHVFARGDIKTEDSVMSELLRLRLEAQRLRDSGSSALARVLYQEFQLKYQSAVDSGLMVHAFEKALKDRNQALADKDIKAKSALEKSKRTIGLYQGTWKVTRAIPTQSEGPFRISPDASQLMYVSARNKVSLLDLSTGKVLREFTTPDKVTDVQVNWKEGIVALRSSPSARVENLTLKSLSDGRDLGTRVAMGFALHPSLPHVYELRDQLVEIFDLKSQTITGSFAVPYRREHQLTQTGFSNDAKRFLIRTHRYSSVTELKTGKSKTTEIMSHDWFALSPNSSRVAALQDGEVTLWSSMQPGAAVLADLDGELPKAILFTADGARLLIKSGEKHLRIVSAKTGDQIHAVDDAAFADMYLPTGFQMSQNGEALAFAVRNPLTSSIDIKIYSEP